MLKVIKRDGRIVEYDRTKIYSAIDKAFAANNIKADIGRITDSVEKRIMSANKEQIDIEDVQKAVVQSIKAADYPDVARSYNIYRELRSKARQKRNRMNKIIAEISKESDRENANVGNSPSAKMLQFAETTGRNYAENFLLDDEVVKAIESNLIYPHDLSWMPTGSTTCTQIPFKKLLLEGFNTGHGYLRTPQTIRAAMSLAAIIFQANQNDQHGGQASAFFDEELAPFVERDYNHNIRDLKKIFAEVNKDISDEELNKLAWERTVENTKQASEAFIHNLNTMHSRGGGQIPFTSINLGTDTTKYGRLVTKCILEAYDRGLGHGEQPLFPNIIFKVKNGVNYEEGTPNHDLLKLAYKVTANRLYPIYNFQDCTLNKDFPTEVPSMGCRTRISWDRFLPADKQTVLGRGNLSFTTINLPGIVLDILANKENLFDFIVDEDYKEMSKTYDIHLPEGVDDVLVKKFFVRLNDLIELTAKQLYNRFKFQSVYKKKDFPFLMNGVWIDSDKLDSNDEVRDVIKHGTLTVGFIGLAECLYGLCGKHHGESETANKLGLEIVRYMAKKVNDECAEVYDMNYSLLGTPAEGLTGKFLKKDRAQYGEVKGITDKEWYTNSMHIPVEFEESFAHKIEIEGQYIKYLTGGNITYVELSSSPKDNVEAVETIVKMMHDSDIALGAINFPCDRCIDCGYSGTIDTEECPNCGSKNISRIRRITGYLAPLENFNAAKKAEALHRVKHDKIYLEKDLRECED